MRFILLLVVAAGLAIPAFAKDNLHPEVYNYTLNNGLELVVIPDRRAPVVTHMIWYKVGSADDPPGKSGLAHFLEHLLFKGTSTYPEGTFSAAIAEIGGEENAFTSSDYTSYYQKVAPSALRQMMVFEADRMRNVVLTEEVVAPELEVVLEERSQRVDSNPNAILAEFSQASLYLHHPYGNPVIGWEHEINSLTLEDAIAFYEVWYQPSNAIVVVAGDVEPEQVLIMARETYGKIVSGNTPKRMRLVEPKPVAARKVEYHDKRVSNPSWRRSYLVPSYRTGGNREVEALDLLAMILGGASTSRLNSTLVLETQIASYAGAFNHGSARDIASFTVYGEPRGDITLVDLERAIDNEIERIKTDGITQEELDRALKALSRTMIYTRDSQVVLARIYGSELALGGSIEDVHNWLDRLESVSIDDVMLVANKYLRRSRSVTSYLRPEKG